MPTLDEQIAQALRDSQRSGELESAPSYGRPLDLEDGYAQTPPELRMAFKMLKEAGFVPPEVEAMNELAALRRQAHGCTDATEAETAAPAHLGFAAARCAAPGEAARERQPLSR